MGIETLFLTIFVVGLLAIPLLYLLSTREAGGKQGQNQGQVSSKEEQAKLKGNSTNS